MNKLEDIFKKSLENAEAPYDPKAWDSMASRLDQVMPTTPAKGSFKWAWIAGVVLVAGSTALFFATQPAAEKQNSELAQNQLEQPKQDIENAEEIINSQKVETEMTSATENNAKTDVLPATSKSELVQAQVTEGNTQATNGPDKVGATSMQRVPKDAPSESLETPALVKPNKQMKAASVDQKISKDIVYAKLDFSASNETFYEKGLPFNSVTCTVDAKKYTWTNERKEILSTDKNADVHLFTAGTHLITLTIEHFNGDKQSVTKPVRCEVNYNLLAVTGFNPTSSDYRNNTFLPFALLKTERNISFDMQIIDPQTGQVVFETKSVDNAWDGIDMRTNQLVPVNSTYIWRVNIHEKAVGEPTNRYQGTITRI